MASSQDNREAVDNHEDLLKLAELNEVEEGINVTLESLRETDVLRTKWHMRFVEVIGFTLLHLSLCSSRLMGCGRVVPSFWVCFASSWLFFAHGETRKTSHNCNLAS